MTSSQHKNIAVFIYQAFMALLSMVARILGLVSGSASLKERLGFYSRADREKLSIGYNVWLHAASAGEVNAISPFCQAFRKAKPEAKIILTTTSPSGKKIALEKGVADSVFLAPLDMSGPLKRAFQAFRPVMVLVAETEFWPNWLFRTGHNGLPLLLINGRISDRSFPSYMRFKALFSPALNCFGLCLVQTKGDLEKLSALGVSEKRIMVAGQMKYDLVTPDITAVEKFGKDLGLERKDILFTLGSLREGEDDLLLPLVSRLLDLSGDVKLVIAPRHLKNAVVFQEKLKGLGVAAALRSEMEKSPGAKRVIVLDTLGELSLAYALSRAAFVVGTLVPVGGHNVMEPALGSVPVCFGPFTQNVGEAALALVQSGGGVEIQEPSELTGVFKNFLEEVAAKEAGVKGFNAVNAMRGATDRTVAQVLKHWPINNKA